MFEECLLWMSLGLVAYLEAVRVVHGPWYFSSQSIPTCKPFSKFWSSTVASSNLLVQ